MTTTSPASSLDTQNIALSSSQPIPGSQDNNDDVGQWLLAQLSGLNILLLALPLGLVSQWLGLSPVIVLAANIIAIIPLSAIVSDASDELSDYWGVLGGALINATFSNVVELMFGFLAISHDEIHLAQSLMVGSILSDILLILGTCLITAAKLTLTLHFNAASADTLSSLMVVTAMALILPTVLHATFRHAPNIDATILLFSRLSAVVLLLMYIGYLYFQMVTHKDVFLDDVDESKAPITPVSPEDDFSPMSDPDHVMYTPTDREEPTNSSKHQVSTTASESIRPTIIMLIASLATVHCTHQILETVNAASQAAGVSKTFVAMMLVPIASNATEFFSVLVASRDQRINFAISVIMGSIIQVSLFLIPTLVIIGWIMGKAMSLDFGVSHTATSFLAVLMVNNLLTEGKYTYIHGTMLISLYFVLALAVLLQPEI